MVSKPTIPAHPYREFEQDVVLTTGRETGTDAFTGIYGDTVISDKMMRVWGYKK